ncbi:MAG: hypothetical protein WAL71_05410, partial [Terriglobales bacterium]
GYRALGRNGRGKSVFEVDSVECRFEISQTEGNLEIDRSKNESEIGRNKPKILCEFRVLCV